MPSTVPSNTYLRDWFAVYLLARESPACGGLLSPVHVGESFLLTAGTDARMAMFCSVRCENIFLCGHHFDEAAWKRANPV